MEQSTGGHWLETREGLVLLDPQTGRAEDDAETAAWRAYVEHAQPCEECARRLFNCPRGKDLWDAYRAFRTAS